MGWFSKKQTPSIENIEVVSADDNVNSEIKEESREESKPDELELLRKELAIAQDNAKRYKDEAERATRDRNSTVEKLSDETEGRIKAEEVAIANAITAYNSEADRLQKDLVSAQENGKFEDAAKLHRELASTQFKIDEWSNKKANLETQKKQPKIEVRPSEDDLIATELQKYNQYPNVKEWLGNNRKYFTDAKFRTKVDAAHYDAVDAGHAFGTKEYSDFVEEAINGKQKPRSEIKEERKIETRESRRVAAPPSRGATMSNNSGKETIKLTAQEVEFAQIANPQLYAKDPAKAVALYAAEQKRLTDEGKIRRWN